MINIRFGINISLLTAIIVIDPLSLGICRLPQLFDLESLSQAALADL